MENEQLSPSPLSIPCKRYRFREMPDWVRAIPQPPFPLMEAQTPAAKLGVRYERKVHWRLEGLHELCYIPSQWFMYHSRGRIRYCQFDGLLVLPERQVVVLCEVKYNHTSDAYWQLENTYLPVLRRFLGPENPWRIATCEIVKWFDPSTSFPVQVHLCPEVALAKLGAFNVHILNR